MDQIDKAIQVVQRREAYAKYVAERLVRQKIAEGKRTPPKAA